VSDHSVALRNAIVMPRALFKEIFAGARWSLDLRMLETYGRVRERVPTLCERTSYNEGDRIKKGLMHDQ